MDNRSTGTHPLLGRKILTRIAVGVAIHFLGSGTTVVFAQTAIFVEMGDEWKYFRGDRVPSPDGPPATEWRTPGFDDAAWEAGPTPIGYEAGRGGFLLDIATPLEDMRKIDDDRATPEDESQAGYASFYARRYSVFPENSWTRGGQIHREST